MEKFLIFVMTVILAFLVDLLAAWMIAKGLNEAHVHVGVVPVLWVVMGASVALQTTRSTS